MLVWVEDRGRARKKVVREDENLERPQKRQVIWKMGQAVTLQVKLFEPTTCTSNTQMAEVADRGDGYSVVT